ncbi:MAG: hypothetical protein JWM86_2806 [Thermoleophilia bacterium]|nr:hypothetical protein [Thermoleophilia bacterium]
MTTSAEPTIHPVPDDGDAEVVIAELTDPARDREPGLHVIVSVTAGGNTAYGYIDAPGTLGHGSQRFVRHARRGPSAGGWTAPHHPRSEAELGAWRAPLEDGLDRLLIDHCKQAWALAGDAPYVVEFPARPFVVDQVASGDVR